MTDLHPFPAPPALDCWYLTGPTAAGKTRIGVELAHRLGAEIISLDSMAVYQGMDIGTAKPSAEDRRRVAHHLLDQVPPTEDFSLSEYVDAAHAAIADIRGRGREVLFVGGTPLYLKSLLRGVYQGPPADWEFRRQIESELGSLPDEALHRRLEVIDPLLAAKLHPNDTRRIVRGLEVFRLTGQRLSHLQTQFDEVPAGATKVFVLTWPREELHQRIEARVEQMFAAGLVDEVRGLLAQYGTLSRTAMQAVGYREVIELLGGGGSCRAEASGGHEPTEETGGRRSDVGDQKSEVAWTGEQPVPLPLAPSPTPPLSLASCIDRVKARTRQFARRQETWFRSLAECRPIEMREGLTPTDVSAMIEASAARPGTPA
jgi:tRNA dimethylallyltransferase